MPHAPQLAPSLAVFTHEAPQAVRGAAHVHAALTQVCIGPQAVAHMMLLPPATLPPADMPLADMPPAPPKELPPAEEGPPPLSEVEEQLVLKAPASSTLEAASATRTQPAW